MIYSTPQFLALLILTMLAYQLAKGRTGRSTVLLVSSTLFYAWSGWVDLLVLQLVMLASWLTVFFGKMYPRRRKAFTAAGIALIVAHLVFWKYTPWLFGWSWVAPLGISFYTLQKIGYLVDVFKGRAEPLRFREYLLFNGFFAQLVAGPIARARALAPQLSRLSPIEPRNLAGGSALFMLGFAKKLVIADNLGVFVDKVFARPHFFGRFELVFAVVAFTCQLWADFSAYTDMGRGAARIFGIELPENFLSPFLSRGPSEFWRRWHITLSEWIRDYVFVPLWSRHRSRLGGALVLLSTLAIAGLWHGADWIFVVYGLYWGTLLVLEHYWRGTRLYLSTYRNLPSWVRWALALPAMFCLLLVSRLLFRAGNFERLGGYLSALEHPGPFTVVNLELFVALVAVSILFQVATYRSLEPGAQPLWRQASERASRKVRQRLEEPRAPVGSLGFALGAALGLVLVASLTLSLAHSSRVFIYWSPLR
ncbi:MAG TPA: MBOAT family O-acyltransferase [Bdellovibrionota bacterium]|nr:MBOAT family O-acyltransferase [Bdellovibrionota bacterium]